jgi:hypothetical protein
MCHGPNPTNYQVREIFYRKESSGEIAVRNFLLNFFKSYCNFLGIAC